VSWTWLQFASTPSEIMSNITNISWLISNYIDCTLCVKGDFMMAIDLFTKCIELFPDRVVPYTNRALCYLRLDNVCWVITFILFYLTGMIFTLHQQGSVLFTTRQGILKTIVSCIDWCLDFNCYIYVYSVLCTEPSISIVYHAPKQCSASINYAPS